jgi:hypothetical protein
LRSVIISRVNELSSRKQVGIERLAFDERRKIHDLLMEGVELALKKRGYPALADMKAKLQRKER